MRVIPRRTRITMELFRGFTLFDVLYLLGCAAILILFITSNLDKTLGIKGVNIMLGIVVTGVLLSLMLKREGSRLYMNVGWFFKYVSFKKRFAKKRSFGNADVRALVPYVGIIEGNIIDFKDYYGMVIEIEPLEFGLLNEHKQNMLINSLANGLRRLIDGQQGAFYKINKAMVLDQWLAAEDNKLRRVRENMGRGMYSEKEFKARKIIFDNRKFLMTYFNETSKIYKDHFYLVLYDRDRRSLRMTMEGMQEALASSSTPLLTHQLNTKELLAFLKSNYTKDFNEREIDDLQPKDYLKWLVPEKVRFKAGTTEIDGVSYTNFVINNYPGVVGNAWGYEFFAVQGARVVMNFKPIPQGQAIRMIDKSIIEMETQLLYSAKTSVQIEKQTALESMRDLLVDLKTANEALFDCNIHICVETPFKKDVRATLKENDFKYNEMFCRQTDALLSTNVSKLDTVNDGWRGIHTTSVAAVFPFISSAFQDEGGFYVGYNQYAVFMDFFRRDMIRVNSNMIIIGKSGSGKSFATKMLISNLAADDGKIFVCDPENEYEYLCRNLGGKVIDVGSGLHAKFNPFHIMATLEDESNTAEGGETDSYSQHLQFLEEFFRMILEGISSDALEMLNRLIVDMYKEKNIDSRTDITKLKPEDFPIFDDLYGLTLKKHDSEKDEYLRINYKVVINYMSKFASGGRNSMLWNGHTSIEANENFVVFSFRSLLANRNQAVARAQMLLTFKYLDNEIIRNREWNLKFKTNRKIVVAVDEAHVFINPKYPIALDFMYQMAKRIRKYNGMQIIITQNVRDFMGSDDMIRQSSAIIAASQYSMIFSMAPNDVTELVKLYKNAGEINETEQEQIATAPRGQCFLISGPMNRTQMQIEVTPEVRELFDN